MNRFIPGNRIALLRSGREFFAALIAAIDGAQHEIWLETYIFADDEAGRRVADALARAAQRGVAVRVMVDGWGAKYYLTHALEQRLRRGGVELLKYRPEVAPWHFRGWLLPYVILLHERCPAVANRWVRQLHWQFQSSDITVAA
jgi:cardiolipin synthase